MIQQLTFEELEKWRTEGRDFLLVDVRENWEREAFSLGGEHIPLGEIANRTDILKGNRTVVFYCRKGIRSQIAVQRLSQKADVSKCYNLAGGVVKIGNLPTRWILKN